MTTSSTTRSSSSGGNAPGPSVRGHSTATVKPSVFTKLIAILTDLLLAVVVTEIIYACFNLSPVPDSKFWILLIIFWLIPMGISRLRKQSFGEWIWKIERVGESRTQVVSAANSSGIFLTLLLIFIGYGLFKFKIARAPEWTSNPPMAIDAVLPPSNWRVLAFHYTLAAWPPPRAYFIPYEFGPPKRFVGKVEALWSSNKASAVDSNSDVESHYASEKLVFEGPKTPQIFASGEVTRKDLKDCVLGAPSFHCAWTRELAIKRPLEEMRKQGYSHFELRWFSAENPVIPAEERAQGIYLHSFGGPSESRRFQDRYILVGQKGMQQSLILSYTDTNTGPDSAPAKLKIALGTLRFSEDLNPGRAWVDRELEATHLGAVSTNPDTTQDPEYVQKLMVVAGLLVSKISVEPGPIESYYHLAGIQSLLLRYGEKHHRPDIMDDAKQMLDQVQHFARDIAATAAPESPTAEKSHEIEKLWHEAQKL